MNAWLLTWEGTEGPAVQPDRKLLAILSSRCSSSTIETLVDTLYCRSISSAYDMAAMANKRKLRTQQYKATFSTLNRIFYGHNPCIFARRVCNLTIKRNEKMQTELIEWIDLAGYENAETGNSVLEAYPEKSQSIQRALKPLALDIYARYF